LILTARIVFAALVAAALELDTYFVGMTLISQPIIVGGIAGYMFGDLQTGIIIGTMVQLIWVSPPVGAHVPPSSSAIAFTGAALSAQLIGKNLVADRESLIMLCIIAGVGTGYFVGQMDIWNRNLNTRIMHLFEQDILKGSWIHVILTQAFALLVKYISNVVIYIIMFSYGAYLLNRIFSTLSPDMKQGLDISYCVMPVIGMAVIFDLFRTKLGTNFYGIILILCYLILWTYRQINPLFFALAVVSVCCLVIYNFVWDRKEA